MNSNSIEIIINENKKRNIKAVIFDFDGTISTLRQGWEETMQPMMIEMICGKTIPTEDIINMVNQYIDESTGIQTIYQMEWLQKTVLQMGLNKQVYDPWHYKDEYNNKLMIRVNKRKEQLLKGELNPDDYRIMGSVKFLDILQRLGIDMYLASGTDHDDVVKETKAVGVNQYFTQIAGAPMRKASCSKEKVIKDLILEKGFNGEELAVIGDGKVEIALGCKSNALTLGMATDERNRFGVNKIKRERLISAGAHAITGDFLNTDSIIEWMGFD